MEEPQPGSDPLKLLKFILRHTCTHRFSWPRIGSNGQHYQICLACGTAYEYDWEGMKRTDRVLNEDVQGSELRYAAN
jgi:hypothetical protein